MLRCRICEELISGSTLAAHSKLCAQLANLTQAVRRVNSQLENRCTELENLLLSGKLDSSELATSFSVLVKHGRTAAQVPESVASPESLSICLRFIDNIGDNVPHRTAWIRKAIIRKIELIKRIVKLSFEIDSIELSVQHVNVNTSTTTTTNSTDDGASMYSRPKTGSLPTKLPTMPYKSRNKLTDIVHSPNSARLRKQVDILNSSSGNQEDISKVNKESSQQEGASQSTIQPPRMRRTHSVDKLRTTPVLSDANFRRVRHQPLHTTKISDFQILKPISRGAFGAVYLVRKKVTSDLFAVKVINKIEMMQARPKQVQELQLGELRRSRGGAEKLKTSGSALSDNVCSMIYSGGERKEESLDKLSNMVPSSRAAIAIKIRDATRERSIMSRLHNPFVVPLVFSFQSLRNLFLVMPFFPGGDLHSLLKNLGCLEESVCSQYTSEIVLALRYLHSKGVIHRDLKPDNCLIDHEGHIKLTDFGLSEQAVTRRARKMMKSRQSLRKDETITEKTIIKKQVTPQSVIDSSETVKLPSRVRRIEAEQQVTDLSDGLISSRSSSSSFGSSHSLEEMWKDTPAYAVKMVPYSSRDASKPLEQRDDGDISVPKLSSNESCFVSLRGSSNGSGSGDRINFNYNSMSSGFNAKVEGDFAVAVRGTPDYLAPELLSSGNSKLGTNSDYTQTPAVDWWALGIMMFEMLVGVTPFNAATVGEVFDRIRNWDNDTHQRLKEDRDMWAVAKSEGLMSDSAEDLILHLLDKDPAQRFAAKRTMVHEFFHDLNWDEVRNREPPFRPDLENEVDTSYFDSKDLLDLSALLADDEVLDLAFDGEDEEAKQEYRNDYIHEEEDDNTWPLSEQLLHGIAQPSNLTSTSPVGEVTPIQELADADLAINKNDSLKPTEVVRLLSADDTLTQRTSINSNSKLFSDMKASNLPTTVANAGMEAFGTSGLRKVKLEAGGGNEDVEKALLKGSGVTSNVGEKAKSMSPGTTTPSPRSTPRRKLRKGISAPHSILERHMEGSGSFDFVNQAMLQEMNKGLLDAVMKAKGREDTKRKFQRRKSTGSDT